MHCFYSARDIPGKNTFTRDGLPGIVEEEAIFVEIGAMIQYHGQPCGIIVANSMALANYAATLVKITYKKVRGKEPLKFGQLLSIIDSLRDEQNSGLEEDFDDNSNDNDNGNHRNSFPFTHFNCHQ